MMISPDLVHEDRKPTEMAQKYLKLIKECLTDLQM